MLEMYGLGFGLVWLAVLCGSGLVAVVRHFGHDWDRAFVEELMGTGADVRRQPGVSRESL
jgi:hypothetical protein